MTTILYYFILFYTILYYFISFMWVEVTYVGQAAYVGQCRWSYAGQGVVLRGLESVAHVHVGVVSWCRSCICGSMSNAWVCMHGSNLNRRCTKSCHGVTASIRGGRLKNFSRWKSVL